MLGATIRTNAGIQAKGPSTMIRGLVNNNDDTSIEKKLQRRREN